MFRALKLDHSVQSASSESVKPAAEVDADADVDARRESRSGRHGVHAERSWAATSGSKTALPVGRWVTVAVPS